MRNQPLTGYILYQKPYGESRSLIYFFSKELGLVHGVGKKNLPLFMPISLFATGKNSLKTFSQSQLLLTNKALPIPQNFGKPMIIALYLNELLLKILGIANVEDAMPNAWQQYECSLVQIFSENTNPHQRWQFALRQFETVLLDELGYAIDFSQDFLQQSINPKANYYYELEQGFVPNYNQNLKKTKNNQTFILGKQLIDWQNFLINSHDFDKNLSTNLAEINELLRKIGVIYRQILDNLLNYQSLKSRELWRQLTIYQKDFS